MEMVPDQSDREFVLTPKSFNIIRQLLWQLDEVRPEPLIQLGWNTETRDFLMRLARSMPGALGPESRARIIIVPEEIFDPMPQGRTTAAAGRIDPTGDIVRYVPEYIANIWPALLDAALHALGDSEALYRTGCPADDIRDALAEFQDITQQGATGGMPERVPVKHPMGRITPNNSTEQGALDSIKSHPDRGEEVPVVMGIMNSFMNDGWVRMEYVEEAVIIRYLYHPRTGIYSSFEFMDRE
ncbi:hypothetical protein AB0B25_07870 [Nocardia sp. NPDC049190]|uniref:hypothetical protein n=1 Tax=Nocardia sp. NPDC049190 TaxID=3155650 RepID=UPI00340FE4F9